MSEKLELSSNKPLIVDYYSDVLCVWAWVSQRRLDELQTQWGNAIDIRCHYMNIFGDTESFKEKWQDRGGFAGYAKHVCEAVTPYESAPVSEGVWTDVIPASSLNAHLTIKAIEIAFGVEAATAFAASLRREFFVNRKDIGQMTILMEVVENMNLQLESIKQALENGSASAALMADYKQAEELKLKGSPSFILDGGRQVLYGNVGYRVLHANIEELIRRPTNEASWC